MNLKQKLKDVLNETLLDLFKDDQSSPDSIESSLTQARAEMAEATEALAAFTATHLAIKEKQDLLFRQIATLSEDLEAALNANDDAQARKLIRKRQSLEKEAATLAAKATESGQRQLELQERIEAMKAQVLDIERKKMDLQIRDRAADAINKINQTEQAVKEAGNIASSPNIGASTLQKESENQVSEDQRNTLKSRMDHLLEEDDIEQELNRLKQQRNQ